MNGSFAGYFTSGHAPGQFILEQMLQHSELHHNDQRSNQRADQREYWSEQLIGFAQSYQIKGNAEIDRSETLHVIRGKERSFRVVFSGTIYNRKSLIDELGVSKRFSQLTDRELIALLYERYGAECVLRLRGMFSFMLWDPAKQMMFGARDHFGIKPFYYARNKSGDAFVFASSIRSILQSGMIETDVLDEAFFHYFTFQYAPEPSTMFTNIDRLPPGHRIFVRADGNVRIERYFDPQFAPNERPFQDIVEQLRETLKSVVRLYVEDGAIDGSFLSSGIDSTAIAAMMRTYGPKRTFSVGFSGEQNETVIAEQTAQALDTEHFSHLIGEQDYFDSLPDVILNQEEPVADPSAVALYHVSKLASAHAGAVLSGEGADELFGGYRIYREPQALRPLQMLPESMKTWIHTLAKSLPPHMKGRGYLLRGTTPLEKRFLGNARIFSDEMKAELVTQGGLFADRKLPDPFEITKKLYERTADWDDVTRMQYVDLNVWMPGNIMAKAAKMTQAHGLEVRVPFLDLSVFELASQIPASYRIAKGTTKYVLRKAMEGVVPDFVLHRPKLGFPVPLRQWLKGESGSRIYEQIASAKSRHFFHLPYVEKLLKAHQAGQADYSRHIWTVYIFTLWHQHFLASSTGQSSQES